MRVGRQAVATLALGVLLAMPSAASAVTITVNTEADSFDPGVCSLREATLSAGANAAFGSCPAGSASDPDTIVLPAGFYAMQFDGPNDDSGAIGDLDLNGTLTVQGAGAASTTISAMQLDRVIDVRSGTATVEGVTLTGGHAGDGTDGADASGAPGSGGGPGGGAVAGSGTGGADGGGIRVASGATLDLTQSVVTANSAGNGGDGGSATAGGGGPGATGGLGGNAFGGSAARGGDGGGIANLGTLVVTGSAVVGNVAGTGGQGGIGHGGDGGGGTTAGGNGGSGSGGFGARGGNGGGITSSGSLTITSSRIAANLAGRGGGGGGSTGGNGGSSSGAGNGGSGGAATGNGAANGGSGGGISASTAVSLTDTTARGNVAGRGGNSGNATGGDGGANTGSGNGGLGGAGSSIAAGPGGAGGGLSATTGVTIVRSTFDSNDAGRGALGGTATGGVGGNAVSGTGGAGGDATGGAGGTGGDGGAQTGGSAITVTNSTYASNATGSGGRGGAANGGANGTGSSPGMQGLGTGGNGGAGGSGGAVRSGNPAIVHSTLAGNSAALGGQGGTATGRAGSANGTAGAAGSTGALAGGGSIQNTIVAGNLPTNCAPGVGDGGHNISFPETSCPGANSDPLLGPLADNGGPTRTFALAAGSPAIDAVPSSGAGCEAVDQRGITRPRGPACEIGAYEVAPPEATTGAATDITSSGATVHGTVNPNLRAASWHFEFGPTTAYGTSTATLDLPAGASPQPVAAPLLGLTPGSTVHYRLVATTADGTSAGADQTVTTPSLPTPFAGVALAKQTVKVKNGAARVRVACPAAAITACAGKLTLKGVGRRAFSIASGKSGRVRVTLSKKARKQLKKHTQLKTTATALAHDARNAPDVKTTASVTLKR
ncbi:MAG: hypothetical protein QOG63_3097 [Thermoleophilaceae bacterium]|nr:hypothetical protein [Thermoleophilaceae bacterium]